MPKTAMARKMRKLRNGSRVKVRMRQDVFHVLALLAQEWEMSVDEAVDWFIGGRMYGGLYKIRPDLKT